MKDMMHSVHMHIIMSTKSPERLCWFITGYIFGVVVVESINRIYTWYGNDPGSQSRYIITRENAPSGTVSAGIPPENA